MCYLEHLQESVVGLERDRRWILTSSEEKKDDALFHSGFYALSLK